MALGNLLVFFEKRERLPMTNSSNPGGVALDADCPWAFPFRVALSLAGNLSPVKGYSEVKAGRLRTFLIGRRRYVMASALKEYLEARERETETADEQRRLKVEKATRASLRRRAEMAGA